MFQYIYINNDTVIASYNLFVGFGLIIGLLYLDYQINKMSILDSHITSIYLCVIFALVFGFLGAYFFDALTQGKLDTLEGVGLTFYGGLLSGLISIIIFIRIFRLDMMETLNLLTPSLVIGHAVGRIGCFFAGCCYGEPTNSPWGIVFPKGSFPTLQFEYGTALHPTQIYEAFFLFVLFVVILKVVSFRYRAIVYFISYGLIRFFIEYLRADDRGTILNQIALSPSQLISIMIVIVGVVLWGITQEQERNIQNSNI